jgi:hypothetical protein
VLSFCSSSRSPPPDLASMQRKRKTSAKVDSGAEWAFSHIMAWPANRRVALLA